MKFSVIQILYSISLYLKPGKYKSCKFLSVLIKRKFHFILVKTIKLINPWVFLKKLNEEKKLDGFVFFSYLQFCYDKNKNENLIKKSIDKNFTIYLAREKMIINKKNYLQKKKI